MSLCDARKPDELQDRHNLDPRGWKGIQNQFGAFLESLLILHCAKVQTLEGQGHEVTCGEDVGAEGT